MFCLISKITSFLKFGHPLCDYHVFRSQRRPEMIIRMVIQEVYARGLMRSKMQKELDRLNFNFQPMNLDTMVGRFDR